MIAQPELRLAMRLAVQMHCTLEELGERMSAEEFGLWAEFLDNEPIGPSSMLSMLAEVLAALANGPLKPRGGRKSFRASDFLDAKRWDAPEIGEKGPTIAQIEAFFGKR